MTFQPYAASASETRRQHFVDPPSSIGQRLDSSRLPAHANRLLVGDRGRAWAYRTDRNRISKTIQK
eukprot:2810324-Prymnesium_polylepis.1